MQEADEPVLLGRLAQDLHDHHVVVDGEVQVLEHRRELELGGRDLVVPRLRRDAELPEALLDLGHEREDARTDRAEVVVVELLVLRGRGAEDRAPRLQQVGTLQVEAAVDEEVLLLGAERDRDVRLLLPELPHQPLRRARDGLDGAQERRLHVERVARERAERRRDAERRAVRVPLDERRRGRIPRRVAARLERRAQPARRERRGVRLAADQVLAGEPLHRLRGARRLQEGVVLLGRAARQRLKPVREVRRALFKRPGLHALGDRVRNRRVEGLRVAHRRKQLRGDGFRQMAANRLLGEDVRTIGLEARVKHICTLYQKCGHPADRKRKGAVIMPRLSLGSVRRADQSAIGRTLPSLTRFSMTCWAMFFGTASYCLKIIVNEPRPCVTVRIAFE